MSLFPSTLTGRILDDGVTEPPVIELQGISAGQLATVLTAYTPQTEHTAHTAAIGVNAAAIAALQGQVAALPASPDLTPYALAADLAALEGSILANASGLVAVNTSLTQGLAGKANQSALDALQVEVNGKSTPASVDLKLANHPTTAAMNSSITSANNSALATVAATYALKSVVDQLALDVAACETAPPCQLLLRQPDKWVTDKKGNSVLRRPFLPAFFCQHPLMATLDMHGELCTWRLFTLRRHSGSADAPPRTAYGALLRDHNRQLVATLTSMNSAPSAGATPNQSPAYVLPLPGLYYLRVIATEQAEPLLQQGLRDVAAYMWPGKWKEHLRP